jgi:integrase/recombinase XerD
MMASVEDVRRFQLHLAANGAGTPILNHTVSALRLFFREPNRLEPVDRWERLREASKPH